MGVIRHAMNSQKFLFTVADDAGHIFVEFFLAVAADQTLAGFDGKNDLEIYLRVGVGHRGPILEAKGARASAKPARAGRPGERLVRGRLPTSTRSQTHAPTRIPKLR